MELRPAYPVETARLQLWPLSTSDLDDLLAYRADPEVCRFLPFEPMTPAVLSARLATDMGRSELTDEGQHLSLGASRIVDGRVIGDVMLFFHSQQHASGEIGYVFHPSVAGQGYATEACSAVLDLAFGSLGLHRVTARMDARNAASARLAERLGMRKEARFRESEMFKGERVDVLIYALLASEWRTRPGS